MQGSASAPTLPAVVPPAVRAAQQRGLREAAKRKEFLGGLINQDGAMRRGTEAPCFFGSVYGHVYVYTYTHTYTLYIYIFTQAYTTMGASIGHE